MIGSKTRKGGIKRVKLELSIWPSLDCRIDNIKPDGAKFNNIAKYLSSYLTILKEDKIRNEISTIYKEKTKG